VLGNFVGDTPGPRDCEEVVELFGEATSDEVEQQFQDARVENIEIAGDRATAKPAPGPNTVELEREEGEWRIDRSVSRGWRDLGIPDYSRAPGGVPGG